MYLVKLHFSNIQGMTHQFAFQHVWISTWAHLSRYCLYDPSTHVVIDKHSVFFMNPLLTQPHLEMLQELVVL
jgi:hypothetical protein